MDLDQYLSRPGAESMAALARALNCNADQIRQWRNATEGRRPSPARCVQMEQVSKGLMTCEHLRPDLTWIRFGGRWPWHRKGRPAIDVSKVAA